VIKTKRCTLCEKEFPATLEYFYEQKSCRDGLNSRCKTCSNKKLPTKTCRFCKRAFPLTEKYFYKNSRNKDGFQSYCKKCHNFKNRERNKQIKKRKTYEQFIVNFESIKNKLNIDEAVTITNKGKTLTGFITNKYDTFFVVDFGKYKESFMYIDIKTGNIKINTNGGNTNEKILNWSSER